MSKENRRQQLVLGAVTVGILGALTTLFHLNYPKKKVQLHGHASDAFNKKMLAGGMAGGVIGAVAALLFAPKSGSELRSKIVHPFSRYLQQNPPSKKNTKKRVSPKKKPSVHKKVPQRPEK